MKQLHKRRLLRLAKFLRERVPDEHFDLGVIVRNGFRDERCLPFIEQLPKVLAGKSRGCGAAACAIGWCPGAFPKHWKWHRFYEAVLIDLAPDSVFGDPSFDSAEKFFGLTRAESWYLFHQSEYPIGRATTRLQVARRIEQFAQRGGMPKRRRV